MSETENHVSSSVEGEKVGDGVVDDNDSESLKRRRVDETNDGDASKDDDELGDFKKSRLEELGASGVKEPASAFSFGSDGSEIVEKIEVSPDKVGQIIGSRGAVIQEMQTRSGCKINVNQDFPPGVNREVTFTGTREQITAARGLIAMVLEQGPTAIHMLNGPVVTEVLECAQALVGRIIGAGGATIRDIQARCGARVQIDQNFPEGVPRKVSITGNAEAVQGAVTMIKFVMENGPPGMYPQCAAFCADKRVLFFSVDRTDGLICGYDGRGRKQHDGDGSSCRCDACDRWLCDEHWPSECGSRQHSHCHHPRVGQGICRQTDRPRGRDHQPDPEPQWCQSADRTERARGLSLQSQHYWKPAECCHCGANCSGYYCQRAQQRRRCAGFSPEHGRRRRRYDAGGGRLLWRAWGHGWLRDAAAADVRRRVRSAAGHGNVPAAGQWLQFGSSAAAAASLWAAAAATASLWAAAASVRAAAVRSSGWGWKRLGRSSGRAHAQCPAHEGAACRLDGAQDRGRKHLLAQCVHRRVAGIHFSLLLCLLVFIYPMVLV
jgi:rRNA processing protein Krr1/Pno1